MSLYRGAGGASDSTDDATVNAVAGYASSAAASAATATTAATSADASATEAIEARYQAEAATGMAAIYSSNAQIAATSAGTHAVAANVSKNSASTSATNASTSASTASSFATYAASSASSASTSATAAAASATAAATSKTGADSAAASALAIYGNTTAMNTAVAAAATSATNAATQATNAAASATTASNAASTANLAVTTASGWATTAQNAANSADADSTSATNSANTATAQATLATTKATAAAASAAAAATSASTAASVSGSGNGVFGATPISTASTLTLSGGTANGVAYLNGSKVLTTGSALTFDGITLGVGVSGSAWDTLKAIDLGSGGAVYGTAGQSGIAANAYYGASGFVYKATNGASVYQLVADSHRWSTAASGAGGSGITFVEGMRLTSTGLGVGTSTINGRITVKNPSVSGNQVIFAIQAATSTSQLASWDLNQTTDVSTFGTDYGAPLAFKINSAEQMRLTSTGLGIGTSSPAAKLDTAGTIRSTSQTVPASGTGAELFYDATNAGLRGYNRTGAAYVPLALNDNVYISGGSSGNVGVGTSSPAAKLNVVGADAAIVGLIAGATNGIRFIPKATSAEVAATDKTGSGSYQQLDLNGSLLTFLTSGTERMRLDASGNLGLGVTPSAWSGYKVMQFGPQSAIAGAGAFSFMGTNWYNDGAGNKYITTAAASLYQQNAGIHAWFNAASGTAGNAISFTQAMTLDASGNLGIGTTSTGYRLHIEQATSTPIFKIAYNGTFYATMDYLGSINTVTTAPGDLWQLKRNGTAQVSLDGYGNLGVGTASPSASAIIDAQSTTKGVRFPNMTTTQKNAISSPAAGLVVFDTTLAKLCVYSGSAWQTITSI